MLTPPEIILTVAMAVETRGLQHLLEDRQEIRENGLPGVAGHVAGTPTWILQTGIGPSQARKAAKKIVEIRPRALISTGLAGALSPAIRPGGLILAHEVRFPGAPEGPGLRPAPKLLATARAAIGGSRISTSTGVLLTVDQPVYRPRDKASLAVATGAIAVDMESAEILRIAAEYSLPTLVLRGISDGARDSLPVLGPHDPASLRGQIGIAAQALRSPRKVRNLISVAQGSRRALKTLRLAHAALVPALARTLREG